MKIIRLYQPLFLLTLQWLPITMLACVCSKNVTTEEAYQRSELVIAGQIIGMDTIYAASTLLIDKKGIKFGKQKYSPDTQKFVRVKILIEKNFKKDISLPDTIYVLTEAECGVHFMPYLGKANIDIFFYQYIVYGDQWIEKSIQKIKKGKKYVAQITETIRKNTFYTSMCRGTQHTNEEEIKKLTSIQN